MRNAVYDLDYGTLETLRMQLNKLRSCKGAKECTIRYKYEGKCIFTFPLIDMGLPQIFSHYFLLSALVDQLIPAPFDLVRFLVTFSPKTNFLTKPRFWAETEFSIDL